MLTKAEEKEIELRAYGKRITFPTRHHWILTWLEEQPGKNLADKVWRVIDRAYRADYAARASRAESRYCQTGIFKDKVAALCEAMEYWSRAGNEAQHAHLHRILTNLLHEEHEREHRVSSNGVEG